MVDLNQRLEVEEVREVLTKKKVREDIIHIKDKIISYMWLNESLCYGSTHKDASKKSV